jgi:hypothetical protein
MQPTGGKGSARKRRLDFSNIDDSSQSLGLGGSTFASNLDVLAAAASQAAAKPHTPATSGEFSNEGHVAVEPTQRRTPSKRSRAHDAARGFPSPDLRSPHPYMSPSKGRHMLSPGGQSLGLLPADDLQQNGLAIDLQALDNAQEGVLDLLREQGMAMDDLPANLSEFGSPFGTPNSLLQVRILTCSCPTTCSAHANSPDASRCLTGRSAELHAVLTRTGCRDAACQRPAH